jgi:serine/threonine-protein kinase
MPLPLDEFVQQIVASRLLSADEVRALIDSLPPDQRPQAAEQLARELVRRGKLTAYQAQQIQAGQGRSLVLGNYVILDKLGQGGMGLVLKAEHRRMKRVVALKVLAPQVVRTPELLRRFQREVEAAAN